MKKYSVIVIVCLLMFNNAWGKLKNGYEKDIHSVRKKLKEYCEMLNTSNNLSASDKRNIKARMDDLITYQSYYELTEELLNQFRRISPGLYNRVDSIKDFKGRSTDVYVKFIPREEALVLAGGVTFMVQAGEDRDVCFSEYGKHSVSIKIWLFEQALSALSHELGHVNYQVPNFEAYTEYYKEAYRPMFTESNCIGHSPSDASGKNAHDFEYKFKKDYLNSLKFGKGDARLESPFVLMAQIRKKAKASRPNVRDVTNQARENRLSVREMAAGDAMLLP